VLDLLQYLQGGLGATAPTARCRVEEGLKAKRLAALIHRRGRHEIVTVERQKSANTTRSRVRAPCRAPYFGHQTRTRWAQGSCGTIAFRAGRVKMRDDETVGFTTSAGWFSSSGWRPDAVPECATGWEGPCGQSCKRNACRQPGIKTAPIGWSWGHEPCNSFASLRAESPKQLLVRGAYKTSARTSRKNWLFGPSTFRQQRPKWSMAHP